MDTLLLSHDPLCGWCYGAIPGIRALRLAFGAQGVPALILEDRDGFRAIRGDALFGELDALVAPLRPTSTAA